MYKVFINDHLITLTNKITKEDDHQLFLLASVRLEEVIRQFQENEIKHAHLYHEDKRQLMPLFKEKLPLVMASGGLVINADHEILFIYRNGKWDLPKGKLDKGETLKKAAVREVEEETGVKGLKIDRFLIKTHHIFKRNGVYKLKETHWYLMHTKYKGKLYPQEKEGIKKVAWKNEKDSLKALKNSYHNIKSVIEAYEALKVQYDK